MIEKFNPELIKTLFKPAENSSGEDNGQVTIIGGSELFHGAPLLSLKAASRIVDMVFFSSPESSLGRVAENMKSNLSSFIWVPWEGVEGYIKKSDAVLIGPGFMRGDKSRKITKNLLEKFPNQRWVIDAGSLQVMEAGWIPRGAILTPNKKEYQMLFGDIPPDKVAKDYNCVITLKGPQTTICSPRECVLVTNGNAGLTKGGTGDVQAGLTVALYVKNDTFLSACAGSFITKKAGDELYQKVGFNYNADDLANQIPQTFFKLVR